MKGRIFCAKKHVGECATPAISHNATKILCEGGFAYVGPPSFDRRWQSPSGLRRRLLGNEDDQDGGGVIDSFAG